MKEIEVKVLEINKADIIRRLKRFGAKKYFEGEVEAVHYDFKDKRLAKEKGFIRLRKMGDRAFLTYKKKISQKAAKIMSEIEAEVDDFRSMRKILQSIGLAPVMNYKKKRTSFELGNTSFEIDEYKEKIPTFMEIEAPDLKTINKWIKKLGIDKNKVKNWNAKQVFNYYGYKF